MSFFKRILDFFRRPEKPAPVQPSLQPSTAIAPAAVRKLAISWEEMLDAKSRLAGYALRPVSIGANGVPVSGTELLVALEAEGAVKLLERRKLILQISPVQWQQADFRHLVSTNTRFLLTLSTEPGEAWRELAAEIHSAGGQVAVDAPISLLHRDVLSFTDTLLLNVTGTALADFERQLRQIHQQYPHIELIVSGVSTWDEYRLFMSLGVSYCVGAFTTSKDSTEQNGEIGQSRLVLIEMLNTLRADGEPSAIAEIAKHDPAIVLKLLQMANAPACGLTRQVTTLDEAIVFLGRDALYRWLSLAMFRIDAGSDRDETLMVMALTRAAFLESLAPENNRQMADELFLVGLFSLFDRLLAMPLEKILEKIHLPEQVSSALLCSEGRYVRFLLLATAMERCRIESAISMCNTLRIDAGMMLDAYSRAMAWAHAE